MVYRTGVAPCLLTLFDQVEAAAPKRKNDNDGTIGDTAHAARKSDHNPDAKGTIRAVDITHDPAGGVDAHELAISLIDFRDPRISYVISTGAMARSYATETSKPWQWTKYTGPDGHFHHCHVSCVADDKLAKDKRPWKFRLRKDAPEPVAKIPTWSKTDMDYVRLITLLPQLLKAAEVIKNAIAQGISLNKIIELIQNGEIKELFLALGRIFFPDAKPEMQASAAAVALSTDFVKKVQNGLNSLMHANLVADGVYGNMTKAAVVAFQKKYGLETVDGYMGDKSMAVLQSELAKTEPSPVAPTVNTPKVT